jgi:hypothetical protein
MENGTRRHDGPIRSMGEGFRRTQGALAWSRSRSIRGATRRMAHPRRPDRRLGAALGRGWKKRPGAGIVIGQAQHRPMVASVDSSVP